ncbi:unnamed protein product [Amoebophrya sp. A25]|nr:unnamed protein product [Amoebophrya sp. A25]|eukprot:GSA25T00003925001.1
MSQRTSYFLRMAWGGSSCSSAVRAPSSRKIRSCLPLSSLAQMMDLHEASLCPEDHNDNSSKNASSPGGPSSFLKNNLPTSSSFSSGGSSSSTARAPSSNYHLHKNPTAPTRTYPQEPHTPTSCTIPQARIISRQHALVRHLRELRRNKGLRTSDTLFVKGGNLFAEALRREPLLQREAVQVNRGRRDEHEQSNDDDDGGDDGPDDEFESSCSSRTHPGGRRGHGASGHRPRNVLHVKSLVIRFEADGRIEGAVADVWPYCRVYRLPLELLEYVMSDNLPDLGDPALPDDDGFLPVVTEFGSGKNGSAATTRTRNTASGSTPSASSSTSSTKKIAGCRLPSVESLEARWQALKEEATSTESKRSIDELYSEYADGDDERNPEEADKAAETKVEVEQDDQDEALLRSPSEARAFLYALLMREGSFLVGEVFKPKTLLEGGSEHQVTINSGTHRLRKGKNTRPLYLALDGIQYPDNMGRLLRVAEALSFDGVLTLGRSAVSPWNWRTLCHSGLSPGWCLPVELCPSSMAMAERMRELNLLPLLASAEAPHTLRDVLGNRQCLELLKGSDEGAGGEGDALAQPETTPGVCLILGSESFGPSADVRANAVPVKVDMASTLIKSLNVYVAGGILMEELRGAMDRLRV